MKAKLSEVLDMKEPLGRLSNEKLPIKIAFKLSKVIKAIDEHLNDINTQRESLFKDLSVEGKDDQKGQLVIPPENVDEFNKQWGELLGVEVELDFKPISFDDLPDVQLSSQDMLKLSLIFED